MRGSGRRPVINTLIALCGAVIGSYRQVLIPRRNNYVTQLYVHQIRPANSEVSAADSYHFYLKSVFSLNQIELR